MYKLGFCIYGPNCRYRHVKLPGDARGMGRARTPVLPRAAASHSCQGCVPPSWGALAGRHRQVQATASTLRGTCRTAPTHAAGPPPDPATLEACKPKEHRDLHVVVNEVNPGVIEPKMLMGRKRDRQGQERRALPYGRRGDGMSQRLGGGMQVPLALPAPGGMGGGGGSMQPPYMQPRPPPGNPPPAAGGMQAMQQPGMMPSPFPGGPPMPMPGMMMPMGPPPPMGARRMGFPAGMGRF